MNLGKPSANWARRVAESIRVRLERKYEQAFIPIFAGPYTQSKPAHSAIYWHQPILSCLTVQHITAARTPRFGFYLGRYYRDGNWEFDAGFRVSKVVALHSFRTNLLSRTAEASYRLNQWLQHRPEHRYLVFDQKQNAEYVWDPEDSPSEIELELSSYGDQNRSSTGKYKARPGSYVGTTFDVGHTLTQFSNVPLRELNSISIQRAISAAAVRTFDELYFVYDLMFPRSLKQGRASNNQRRSLLNAQPDRVCSWSSHKYCSGRIEAAHIIADRHSGKTNPKNLFWLCQFHHRLLDNSFCAKITRDRKLGVLVANVVKAKPVLKRDGRVACEIWSRIMDKRAWILPLRPKSLSHIFS